MPLMVPPAKNYASPLVAMPSVLLDDPPEGRKQIPCEIDWGTMGGPNNTVNINIQNNATLAFSRISTIKVDNSQSTSDVQFLFPDTGDTFTVPAYTPATVFPCFTHGVSVFVSAPAAIASDVTRFQILNFLPPPADIPVTETQSGAATRGIILTSTGLTNLVPATVNGVLENLEVYVTMNTGGAGNSATFEIDTGGPPAIPVVSGEVLGSANVVMQRLISMQNMHFRFVAGLNFNVVATTLTVTCHAIVNLFYR